MSVFPLLAPFVLLIAFLVVYELGYRRGRRDGS